MQGNPDQTEVLLAGFAERLAAMPPPDTERALEGRVRLLNSFARYAAAIHRLDKFERARREAREGDDMDGEEDRQAKAEALERKHRLLDRELDRLNQDLDAAGAPRPDDGQAGGCVPQELARPGHHRAA
jgi:hypothetical protein